MMDDTGVQMIEEAIKLRPEYFSATDCLGLRAVSSKLRAIGNAKQTKARLKFDPDGPNAERFVHSGWPQTVEKLEVWTDISLQAMGAIAAADMPYLRELRVIVDHEDERDAEKKLDVFGLAAYMNLNLESIVFKSKIPEEGRMHETFLAQLLQQKWSTKKLRVKGLEIMPDINFIDIHWDAVLPAIEELTFEQAYVDDHIAFPESLACAALPLLRVFKLELWSMSVNEIPQCLQYTPWLKTLEQFECVIDDVDLTPLMKGLEGNENLKELRFLVQHAEEHENFFFYHLPSLPNLHTLHLTSNAESLVTIFEAIIGVSFPSLKSLTMESSYGIFEAFDNFNVCHMPQLRELYIDMRIAPAGLRKFGALLWQLTSLKCSRSLFSPGNLSEVEEGFLGQQRQQERNYSNMCNRQCPVLESMAFIGNNYVRGEIDQLLVAMLQGSALCDKIANISGVP